MSIQSIILHYCIILILLIRKTLAFIDISWPFLGLIFYSTTVCSRFTTTYQVGILIEIIYWFWCRLHGSANMMFKSQLGTLCTMCSRTSPDYFTARPDTASCHNSRQTTHLSQYCPTCQHTSHSFWKDKITFINRMLFITLQTGHVNNSLTMEFPEILSQNLLCYRWPIVSGKSKIMHCEILIYMPHLFTLSVMVISLIALWISKFID